MVNKNNCLLATAPANVARVVGSHGMSVGSAIRSLLTA